MELIFKKIKHNGFCPTTGKLVAYLCEDNWDDYSFKTTFSLIVFDEYGKRNLIGNVKIGIVGFQQGWVSERFPEAFPYFNKTAFSLGQDEEYYKNIRNLLEGRGLVLTFVDPE